MSLVAQISATGVTAPLLPDIINSLVASYQSIYGSDAYLQPGTQDYQLLSIFAYAINDSNNSVINTYNAYSPSYAQGTGQSSVVKINNMQRKAATYSTAIVTLTGQAGTPITNGIVEDESMNKWTLTSGNGSTTIDIPTTGFVDAYATCLTSGAIVAPISTINIIATPTYGWYSVTNISDAAPGSDAESDAYLRIRQTKSTAISSISNSSAVSAVVANLSGVISSIVYENTTSNVGIPATGSYPAVPDMVPHSICIVFLGGNPIDVCTAIAITKAPGCDTYSIGQPPSYIPTFEPITLKVLSNPNLPYNESTNPYLSTNTINIYYQAAIQASLTATITITQKPGYVSTLATTLKENLELYINGLGIGISYEFAEALGKCTSPYFKLESITIIYNGVPFTNLDISQTFASYFNITLSNIAVIGG